ncbi:hypothetical protein BHE74_00018441 [Ensete ventricosum]|nr:hypothetical protein GW17_00029919 [Ensete ventricosum]RWW73676.1 hypothetical protein BHE74_00018441 [Ensete ventricosum]RZR75875.1 hypothetical protein BHM03_00000457 [Ensete ventricosum]
MPSTTPFSARLWLFLMGNHRRTHHHISSFNPSCCFRPSPAEDTPKRSAPTDTTSSSSSRSKQKRLFRIGSMSFNLSSPRISWMGHIKRSRPSSHDSSSSSSSATTSSPRSGSWSSRGRSRLIRITTVLPGRSASPPVCPREAADDHSASGVSISVVDMDPPLPVPRRAARSEESNSLWERRCGGAALRGLQNQQPLQQLSAVVF